MKLVDLFSKQNYCSNCLIQKEFMMVKSSVLLMSGLVFALTLGLEAEAGKNVVWGPMDEFVIRTPIKKKEKPVPSKEEVSREKVIYEQMKYSSAMNGDLKGLTKFERAYVLKSR